VTARNGGDCGLLRKILAR